MHEPSYAKGEYDDHFKSKKSMSTKKCLCFTALNLTISGVTCVLLMIVLNSNSDVCLDDDMIVSDDGPRMAVKSLSPESSGDWSDDEDYLETPYVPYNCTNDLKDGVEYKTIVDGNLKMRATEFRLNQWDPAGLEFSRYGKRYLKKSGMYEYTKVEQTDSGALYKYKVKMSSMIGPDHADQEQIHHVLINSPRRIVVKVTVKTYNFPYSEAFNIEQIWVLENVDSETMHLMAKTGIDWTEEPNFMIKGFIEKDIAESQVKMGKFLRSIYPLDGQL